MSIFGYVGSPYEVYDRHLSVTLNLCFNQCCVRRLDLLPLHGAILHGAVLHGAIVQVFDFDITLRW